MHGRSCLFFLKLDDFVDARASRRWSSLSAADPGQAARNLLRALSGSSIEERLRIEDRTRRQLVWTLTRLAWRSGSFTDAVKALALLAEAENETWANNATSEFLGRFQILLGGTAVPYLDRLSVLDELVGENRPTLSRLVVKALARAGDDQAVRIDSASPSDELPEKEWRPSTGRENLQCRQAALDRLTMLADRAESELQEDFITAAGEFAMMLRVTHVRPLVERFFDAVRGAYPDAREPLRRAIADVVYRDRKYWKELTQEELAELDALHARFEDVSLKARLQRHVGHVHWECEERPDLRPLAKELLASSGALAAEWAWLTSGEAADAWRLGEALAEEDLEGTLATSVVSLSETGRDLRALCGYISACRRRLGDNWYDQWAEAQFQHRPRPINLLFEVAWRCGATATVARHLTDALRTSSVAPEIVGQLGFGKWAKELEPDLLEDVLRALVDDGHRATALTILAHRIEDAPADLGKWRQLALELITDSQLIRSGQMPSYYWQELALRFVSDYSAEIAAAIIREQADRSAGAWFAEHSNAAQVLHACVEQDPGGVWTALLPQLSTLGGAYMFSIGFPRGLIEQVPSEQVLVWVEQRPDERAPMIARLARKDLSSDETLAARVLGVYGDRNEIASAFFSEYVSGVWVGSASDHWQEVAEEVEGVAKRTKLPKLQHWATDAASRLRRMAEQDRQREEEEDLRGRH